VSAGAPLAASTGKITKPNRVRQSAFASPDVVVTIHDHDFGVVCDTEAAAPRQWRVERVTTNVWRAIRPRVPPVLARGRTSLLENRSMRFSLTSGEAVAAKKKLDLGVTHRPTCDARVRVVSL
jgi:hypothetical protein